MNVTFRLFVTLSDSVKQPVNLATGIQARDNILDRRLEQRNNIGDELVAIKSKNELIADVVALLQSPIKNVVSGLNAGGKIHGLLDAIAERNK